MSQEERKVISSMTLEELVAASDILRPKIDEMITEYFQLHCAAARMQGAEITEQAHLTEYIVICGWQGFRDNGSRCGDVRLLLRDGTMPTYIARGLLQSANEYLERSLYLQDDHCSCGEDDEESED